LNTFAKTKKRVENMTPSGVLFDELRGVWKYGQTQSFMLDISSQLKLKLSGKYRNEIVEVQTPSWLRFS